MEAIKLEMTKNVIDWQKHEDDPDQVKFFSRRLEDLNFMERWIYHNV